jgi:hypothetical protein
MQDGFEVRGRFRVRLFDEDGNVKHDKTYKNLITPRGRLYLAGRAIASGTQLAQATGMKLGNDGTASAIGTSSTHELVGTYLSGSNKTFESGYPVEATEGNGAHIDFRCIWAAGTATSADIEEVAIVNDAATNADSTANNTYAREAITQVNKGASDTLQVDWQWDIGV